MVQVDIVTASGHSGPQQPREQTTERILRALEHPLVDVLNHPTGWLLQRRAEYDVDMETVNTSAARHGVALEINGQPERWDLDDVRARRAKDGGVQFSCSTDAHGARHLDYRRYAVATARRGWIGSDSVLNILPLGRLPAHLRNRRKEAGAA